MKYSIPHEQVKATATAHQVLRVLLLNYVCGKTSKRKRVRTENRVGKSSKKKIIKESDLEQVYPEKEKYNGQKQI